MKLKLFISIVGGLLICAFSGIATYFGLSSQGVIKGTQINLTYDLTDYSKEYDGQKVIANSETNPYTLMEGTLLEGDVEYVVYHGELLDVGETKVTAEIQILNKNGYDVTSMYSIKVNPSKITIKQREITLDVDDTKISYTGTSATADASLFIIVDGSLASGDKIVPYVAFNESKTGFIVEPNIYDVYGSIKNSNYKINFESGGDIPLAQLPLVLQPVSISKVYDGEELIFKEYKIISGTLLANHTIEVEFGDGITDVDESSSNFKIKSAAVYDEDHNPVSEFYNIDISTPANLTIYPASITVKMSKIEKDYDGNGFDASDLTKAALYTTTMSETLENNGFYVDMTDYDTLKAKLINMKDVGTNDTTGRFVLKKDGNTINTANYNITVKDSIAEIKACVVHISYRDFGEISYTGKGLNYDVGDIIQNFYLEGDSSSPAYDEFDKLTLRYLDETQAKQAFANMIAIDKHWFNPKVVLVDSLGNPNKNFVIAYDNRGTVTITKIKLTITGISKEFEYNGSEQSIGIVKNDDACTVISGKLLTGHNIQINYKDKLKNVGHVVCYDFDLNILYNTTDVTKDLYEIVWEDYSELTISPKKVTIGFKQAVTITYGDELPLTTTFDANITYVGIPKSDFIGTAFGYDTVYEQYSDAGTYDVIPSGFKNSNYAVTYEPCKLVVKQKEITLAWDNVEFTYDGTVKIPTPSYGTQVFSFDSCEIKLIGGQIEANSGDEVYTVEAIGLSNKNYKIKESTKSCEFKINKAKVYVKPNDYSITYGQTASEGYAGFKVYYESTDKEVTSFVLNQITGLDEISPSFYYTQYSQISPDGHIVRFEGDNSNKISSNNYEVSFKPGKITVNKAQVIVSVADAELTFGDSINDAYIQDLIDKKKISFEGFVQADDEDLVNTTSFTYKITDVNGAITLPDGVDEKYYLSVGDFKMDVIETINLNECYEFVYERGNLSVTKRSVSITFANSKFKYRGKDIVISPSELKVNDLTPLATGHQLDSITLNNAFNQANRHNGISFTPIIVDKMGNDVSKNYEINAGSQLTITPSAIEAIELTFEYKVVQYQYFEGIIDDFLDNPNFKNSLGNCLTKLADGDTISEIQCNFSDWQENTTNGYKYAEIFISSYVITNSNGEEITDDYYDLSTSRIGVIILKY